MRGASSRRPNQDGDVIVNDDFIQFSGQGATATSVESRLVAGIKALMEVSNYVFALFATFFLFMNLILAVLNDGVVVNTFNEYGEMYAEVVILSVLLGLSLGHKLVISDNRRKVAIVGAFFGTVLVFLGAVAFLFWGIL